jgi:hypothetical protein
MPNIMLLETLNNFAPAKFGWKKISETVGNNNCLYLNRFVETALNHNRLYKTYRGGYGL